jgi:hypothetical protein
MGRWQMIESFDRPRSRESVGDNLGIQPAARGLMRYTERIGHINDDLAILIVEFLGDHLVR